eukprot:391491-Prymnesium_polylepis.1
MSAVALGIPSLDDEDELLEWLANNDTDTMSCLDCEPTRSLPDLRMHASQSVAISANQRQSAPIIA